VHVHKSEARVSPDRKQGKSIHKNKMRQKNRIMLKMF